MPFVLVRGKSVEPMFDFRQIEHQIINPQARPFANGRGLRRLKVGEAERRQCAMRFGKLCEGVDHAHQSPPHKFQRFAQQNQVGVVDHVVAGGAEVNDPLRRRADIAVGVNVGHHIVPEFLFDGVGGREVDVIHVGPQFGQLRRRDGDAKLRFGFGEHHPQPPPQAKLRCAPHSVAISRDAYRVMSGLS